MVYLGRQFICYVIPPNNASLNIFNLWRYSGDSLDAVEDVLNLNFGVAPSLPAGGRRRGCIIGWFCSGIIITLKPGFKVFPFYVQITGVIITI